MSRGLRTELSGGRRLAQAFSRARGERRAALITYLTAGYPDPAHSRDCFAAAADAGADIIEVGFPFSDPMMDGPVIQAANQTVLDSGFAVEGQLGLMAGLEDLGVPRVVMTYATIAATRGFTHFAEECAAAGASGVILPDLPVPEADEWRHAAGEAGLATIFLASSVSSDERIAAIAAASSGWVYATALLGVTGVQTVSDEVAAQLVGRVRRFTDLPVAVGIGVRDRETAARIAAVADGVIVGSAIVRAMGEGPAQGAADRVHALVSELRAGVGEH